MCATSIKYIVIFLNEFFFFKFSFYTKCLYLSVLVFGSFLKLKVSRLLLRLNLAKCLLFKNLQLLEELNKLKQKLCLFDFVIKFNSRISIS